MTRGPDADDEAALIDELRGRWDDLAVRAGMPGEVSGRGRLVEELLRRYQEPHRRYHGLRHVRAVLVALDGTASSVHLASTTASELAVWFHDAVYEPQGAGADEDASAELAGLRLREAGADPALVADVDRLVRRTATHDPTSDDEAAVCDADLAVLAADPATYRAYVEAVRQEYQHVPEDQWRAGRSAVLERLLSRPLFHTPQLRTGEATARRNLETELAELLGGRTRP